MIKYLLIYIAIIIGTVFVGEYFIDWEGVNYDNCEWEEWNDNDGIVYLDYIKCYDFSIQNNIQFDKYYPIMKDKVTLSKGFWDI
jgi:hypothetical protein